MAQVETVERILHSATLLFAERGFAETSLRTITGMADVNLAAVNYHFGSKKELIQAVFFRFLSPYCKELDKKLDELEENAPGGESPSAEDLLRCMFETLLYATEEIHEDPQIFMRLLGLAYTQSQEHLRHYMIATFGSTYTRFVELIKKVCPSLDSVEFYWRLYFMLGAGVFTLSSYDSIRAILNADYQEDTSLKATINMMIPPIAKMLTSPNAR
ncbi:TetR/AcrR family transcriptional regulator [Agarilytica rhodophyticola]|uniref:TetR/AcrR family transcriptional regulator n=1 Tax=Agarilytica rhodophyticola TaxID=1737490 RepID=UPI000B343A45|nr:TetR/AcrR family transcriptional regulator [Agarilytica rhodophyticola]